MEDGIQRAAQLGKVGLFADIGVRVQIVGSVDIGGQFRIGQHHHRYAAQPVMLLDVLQDFKTILPRHIEVEEQQVRGVFLHQRSDRLVAILDRFEIVRDSRSSQTDLNQPGNCPVVLSKHNAGGPIALIVCNHQKSLTRPRLLRQFVLTNQRGSREHVLGDCVLQSECNVTTHVYISYRKIANG